MENMGGPWPIGLNSAEKKVKRLSPHLTMEEILG
jgi:hypothetical protein